MKRKALISGITGQDGSYLAEYLLELGYEVHGIVRRVAIEDPAHRLWRLKRALGQLHIHAASLESYPSIYRMMTTIRPDEVYHLAAQSFVSDTFEDEFATLNTNINGTHYMLSAVRDAAPQARFYFAGTSEMFGECGVSPQNEGTPFHPRSAYGISKVAGFHLTQNYREAYHLYGCSGILFNHESPRRGFEFVTRKITSHAAKIKLGQRAEEANADSTTFSVTWNQIQKILRVERRFAVSFGASFSFLYHSPDPDLQVNPSTSRRRHKGYQECVRK